MNVTELYKLCLIGELVVKGDQSMVEYLSICYRSYCTEMKTFIHQKSTR